MGEASPFFLSQGSDFHEGGGGGRGCGRSRMLQTTPRAALGSMCNVREANGRNVRDVLDGWCCYVVLCYVIYYTILLTLIEMGCLTNHV